MRPKISCRRSLQVPGASADEATPTVTARGLYREPLGPGLKFSPTQGYQQGLTLVTTTSSKTTSS
jgi:hypothetical protein